MIPRSAGQSLEDGGVLLSLTSDLLRRRFPSQDVPGQLLHTCVPLASAPEETVANTCLSSAGEARGRSTLGLLPRSESRCAKQGQFTLGESW